MSSWHLAMESKPVYFMVMAGYTQNPSKHVAKRGQAMSHVEGIFSPVLVLNMGQVYPQTLSMDMKVFWY